MLTKFAHILGPILVGTTALLTEEPKFIIMAVLPMFVLGGVFLTRVTPPPLEVD